MEREFKGVWIPAEIWLDHDLTMVEKALLAEIDSFTGSGRSFFKSNDAIQEEYGVSRPTITKAIAKLEARGLITRRFDGRTRHLQSQADCKNVSGRKKTTSRQTEKTKQAGRKNRTAKTKEKEQRNHIPKIIMPFDSEEFIKTWDLWKDYKRTQHQFTYKGVASEQAALKKLSTISNTNEQTAITIIHESIAQGWKGLWPPKPTKDRRPGAENGEVIAKYLQQLSNNSSGGVA